MSDCERDSWYRFELAILRLRLEPSMRRVNLLLRYTLFLCVVCAVFDSMLCLAQSPPAEWEFYGGNQAGTRYSPLKEINRSNVAQLRRAWVYHTGELELGLQTASFKASFSCTPLVINGVMYLSTPSSRVIALEAETGKEIWKFDPQAGKKEREFNSHRGVSN